MISHRGVHTIEEFIFNGIPKIFLEVAMNYIVHEDETGFEPPIIKVQVRSTPGKIGGRDVSSLYGKVSTNEFGLLISLGEFSPQARQFSASKTNLRLIDEAQLVDIIFEHYIAFDSNYKGIIPLKKSTIRNLSKVKISMTTSGA